MSVKSVSLERLWATIEGASRILIVSHYHPDADAYGSQCGLGLALEGVGKSVIFVNQDGPSEKYAFLPGVSRVRTAPPDDADSFDLIIACDCGDEKRLGDDLAPLLRALNVPIVNIDHHVSNNYFGAVNFVDATASSTSEIIYALLETAGVSMSAAVATCLLAGIMGDTGSFRYGNTTARSHMRAARLLEAGADLNGVSCGLFGSTPLHVIRMHADAILHAEFMRDGKIVGLIIDAAFLEKHHCSAEDTESLVEQIRDILGVEIAFFIREDAEVWKISLRASNPQHDLSAVAKEFGGGGHRSAAAFRWRGTLSDLRTRLESRLIEELDHA